MKNLKALITTAAALLAMAVTSSANVYTDTNTHNVDISEGQTVTGQWSYSIGAGETVVSVESWFNFSSEDSDKEEALVKVGVGEGVTDQTMTSSFTNFGSFYTVHFNASSLASLLADAANGLLSYSVTATNIAGVTNDFTFTTAKVAVTTSGGNRVPDGGATLALLGLSLVGCVAVQRKFRLVR